ncbi:MAG: OmpA family protein [Pseudomonadota bacterium]
MNRLMAVMASVLVFIFSGLAWGEVCEQGRTLYEQAAATGDPATKAQLLEESMAACPGYAAAVELGKTYAALNRLRESETALQKALELAGDDSAKAAALAYLGQVYAVTGRNLEATEAFRESYKLHPFSNVRDMLVKSEGQKSDQPLTAAEIVAGLKDADQAGPDAKGVNLRVTFAYGRTTLDAEGEAQAAQLALALNDQAFEGREFVLIGHTDRKGSDEVNKKISKRRAEALRDFLAVQYSLDPSLFHVEGKGKDELLYTGETEEDDKLNRRVEVKLFRPEAESSEQAAPEPE